MPRVARLKESEGYFYIKQRAAAGIDLFRDEADRQHFLNLLKRLESQQNLRLMAYCLKSDEGYQLVIHLQGADLSKAMKSLNISYAMYRKAESSLFKDRFHSTMLEHEKAAYEEIAKMTCGNVSESWTKYCEVLELKENCQSCIQSNQEAASWLEQRLNEHQMGLEQLNLHKDLRNIWILELRKQSTLSLKAIGQVFGGLTESMVCKIIKCSELNEAP